MVPYSRSCQLHSDRLYRTTYDPTVAGHPREKDIYESMRRLFYWPYMANDGYIHVEKCVECRRHRRHPIYWKLLWDFLPKRHLEFVAIDILGPLSKTKLGNTPFVVITDRQSKLTGAIPTGKTTAAHIASILSAIWIMPYGMHNHILTDNGPRFAGKRFHPRMGCLAYEIIHENRLPSPHRRSDAKLQ